MEGGWRGSGGGVEGEGEFARVCARVREDPPYPPPGKGFTRKGEPPCAHLERTLAHKTPFFLQNTILVEVALPIDRR